MGHDDVQAPEHIVAFWFPEGDAPGAEDHLRLWNWRQRGGAHHEVVARYSALTASAAAGGLDRWAQSPVGRLALIVILDQFTRSVWAGTPRAYACDPKARDLCLQGLDNGHFAALHRVWHQAAFRIPLEHCECDDPAEHLANLDTAIGIADRLVDQAPEGLRSIYELGAGQPRRHRAVIARFGRHPHRNAILGRESTPQELAFIATGDLPRTKKPVLPGEPLPWTPR